MDYTLEIRTQPTIPVSWLNKAKHQCRVELDETYDDEFLTDLLVEAHAYISRRSDITMLETGLRLTLPRFPRAGIFPIYLPRPPLARIDGIRYVTPENQEVIATVGGTLRMTGHVSMLSTDDFWPATRANTPDAVVIDYTSGQKGESNHRPEMLRAIKLLVGHWYRYREDSLEMRLENIPHGVDALTEHMRPGDEFTKPIQDGRD